MAEAVLAAAPARFALAGNSMGAWISQDVAARAPERVTKLALIATWAHADPAFNERQREAIREIKAGRFTEIMREHARNPDLRNDPALLTVLHEMQDRAGPAVVARHIQAMIDRYDSTACLPRIICPTIVIAGRQDPLFSVAEHAVQNGRLAVVEDAGHAVQRERPQAVTALMRYWLTYY